ncbi:MAG: hypothetical protein KVP17_004082 [Porospora cf. gigantea B]|uniref:uncharacterized protein n=1 Tax=Porospora cf. gigantea B TaxID=2853592 RepID=UPI003571A777|nr:MAG: hypothetical protein KVP17_004082 [Porospora cf. gigantea B]
MSRWDLGEVFSWYDRDADGLVDNGSLLDMLRSCGMCIAYGDVSELKQHYPLDGVCTFIQFQRLAKLVATRQKSFDAEKELREAFDFLNDGGRHVELSTVRHLLLSVGENITVGVS